MDGEAVFHDDAGAEEADARDHLAEHAQVVVVDGAAAGDGVHDDALAEEYEEAGADGHQRVGGEACAALFQLALEAYDDAGEQGTGETEDEDLYWHGGGFEL